eukprot:gene27484-33189_t
MEEIICVNEAYNQWSAVYDTNSNPTRDVEALAVRKMVTEKVCVNSRDDVKVLEIGCGTGKNTAFYASLECVSVVVAVDLSEMMLEQARKKVLSDKVTFQCVDILQDWDLFLPSKEGSFDIVSFSLVLEHIEDLNRIFALCYRYLKPGGVVYVGELHPFKQYMGSKARFFDEKSDKTKVLTCFTHHTSEFISSAQRSGLGLLHLSEHFDDECNSTAGEGGVEISRNRGVPRILSLLFEKRS